MGDRRHILRPGGAAKAALLALFAVASLVASLSFGAAAAQAAPPANDDFANATVLAATLPANESGNLTTATRESGEPDHTGFNLGGGHTVWYQWTPAVDTAVAVGTCGSDSYAAVSVYGHGPVDSPGARLGTTTGCLNGTSTIVHAEAGQSYFIAVENVNLGEDPGDYTLKLQVAGSLAGRVLNESSEPVADHCISVIDPDTDTTVTTEETGSDGRWSVELPPASYRVRFDGCTSGGPYAMEFWQNAADVDAATTIVLAPGQARTGVDATLEPSSSIAGTLTRPGGDAVGNACVSIYDPEHPEREVASTTTDPAGHYGVTNLSAASYKVLFDPGCNISSDLLSEYYNDKSSFATADLVTLVAGQSLGNVNAELGDGASISGTVSDIDHNPIDGICVSAKSTEGDFEAGAQTGSNGNYSIGGLPPGSYVVRFNDCMGGNFAGEYYDDSPDAAGADPVTLVREQDVTGIDAELSSNGSITGTVTGPADEQLEGICVVAFDAADNEVSSALTDNSGAYAITGLSPGAYRLHFVDCTSGAYVDEYFDDRATLEDADAVSVQAGQESSGTDAQLASAGAITGTVTGPGGAPAPDVCVSALSAEGNELQMGSTDENGDYLITHLTPGSFKVIFRDCGNGDLAAEFYDDKPTFATADLVQVQQGLQTEGIDAQLAAAGSISGTVTAEGTAPAGDVCISAFSAADAIYPVVVTASDGDGAYKLSGLASGSYKVYFDGTCSPDQLSEEFYDSASTFASATPISVTASADHGGVDVDLSATQEPTVTIEGGPSGGTADATPTFTFSRTGGGAVECSIDTGTANYGACSNALSHTPASNLSDGAYTFRVRVSNAAGEQVATRAFSVDTTPPTVSVTGGPTGATNQTQPSFTFAAQAGSEVQCSVDSGSASYGPCTTASTHQPASALSEGNHTFRVRATDAVGNSSVATRTFSVDTTAPAVSVTGGPNGATDDAKPTFTFDGENGATFACSIAGGAASFGTCSASGSHTPASNLTDGSYTFTVRATDAAGNAATATRTFSVDTAAPDTTIDSGPQQDETITTASAQFTFSATEGGSTFECSVDSGAYASCTSPHTMSSLSNGSHSFAVRATDPAGNTDATPASRTFTVDTSDHTPPETTITTGPAEGSTITSGATSFAFTSNEGGSTFECKLDSGGFQSCTSPQQLSGLANGSHTFSVRATDANGNVDGSPATRTFTVAIDSTPPDTVIDSGPEGTITTDSGSFAFHSTESGSTFECKLDSGSYGSCTSPYALSALANGSHTFSVRATDGAGNTDPSAATRTFTVQVETTPVDPTGPFDPPKEPDPAACDAAKAQLTKAQKSLKKAKTKLKKAKSKGAKKKAKKAVKKAKQKVSAANGAVSDEC
ncbi:MAG: carboxypeptidase regulatory-like domain-containing protein [Solirubrobacterales bacterium]|nr:carboxypeptidase regulatory-like domain-containing protein [Solirubrobacterales bacterium]MCB8969200.1 carboxypeptidase regulatory-like domain-containing protein [Thermoleophilales bacterium]MCO5328026.1 carboxypeptidase regulatory-like domain-containing protein [Solirubrobacterales bacterium]